MSDDHHAYVHDAVGPDMPLREAGAALALGVIALLMAGVLPAALGALADEHRLSASAIGLTAAFEALTMGLTTAAAGIVLPPRHLRFIAAAAALCLAGADFACLHAEGEAVLIARALAGVPEGVLLWITTGMIARTATPERWAGVFFTALCSGQLVAAFLFAQWILPGFGADGGFVALAVTAIAGVAVASFVPKVFAPLVKEDGFSGAPPARGWFALFATFVYVGGSATVGVYLQPLAHEAGLDADVARTAVWISLAAQIAGGAVSTALAGHIRWLTVFSVGTLGILLNWAIFLSHPSAWGFIGANALGGFMGILVAAFVVPMTIESDPSRRAAALGGATQVLAGAAGPLLSSRVVADNDVHGAVFLGAAALLAGLALIAALHYSAPKTVRAESA